jgi:catechol 2,3-dioxygenase-like lactoylglutathione lyase family enzyme
MTHITQMSTVLVPVADQARSVEFFTGTLGFEKLVDFTHPSGERWVEVAPPGAQLGVLTRLSLVRSSAAGVETGVTWDTADVEADHAELHARGLAGPLLREGDPPVTWAGATLAGIPAMFLLRDPDGNTYLIVQQP